MDEVFHIKAEKNFNNLFLFPDSSLGITIYTYESPFHEGTCGACSEQHLKIFRVAKNKKYLIFDYETTDISNYIKVNNKLLFCRGDSTGKDTYKFLQWTGSNEGPPPNVKVEWKELGKKINFSFVSVDDDDKKVISN